MAERFYVATVHGWLKYNVRVGGLSAHVLDRAWCHRVVATFRSEDKTYTRTYPSRQSPIGAAEAIRRAEARAAELNATVDATEPAR